MHKRHFLGFVIPNEVRDLHCVANCRSLTSFGMTIYRTDDKSNSSLTNLQHNLAVVLAFLHQGVGGAGFVQRENFSDHGMELAGGQPF